MYYYFCYIRFICAREYLHCSKKMSVLKVQYITFDQIVVLRSLIYGLLSLVQARKDFILYQFNYP